MPIRSSNAIATMNLSRVSIADVDVDQLLPFRPELPRNAILHPPPRLIKRGPTQGLSPTSTLTVRKTAKDSTPRVRPMKPIGFAFASPFVGVPPPICAPRHRDRVSLRKEARRSRPSGWRDAGCPRLRLGARPPAGLWVGWFTGYWAFGEPAGGRVSAMRGHG